jgi:hypothetical protein
MEKEDWKGFAKCLTPDSRDMFAAGIMVGAAFMTAFAGDEGKEAAKEVEAVMKKHGIDEKTMEGPPLGDPSADPKEAMKKAVAPIKDREAFIGDMMTAMSKMKGAKTKGGPMPKEATLKDVKIDGDTATATIVAKADGKDVNEPIKFKKIDGAWKMEMDMDRKAGGGPGAGGPDLDGPKFSDAPKLDDLTKPKDEPKAEEKPKDEPPKSDEK